MTPLPDDSRKPLKKRKVRIEPPPPPPPPPPPSKAARILTRSRRNDLVPNMSKMAEIFPDSRLGLGLPIKKRPRKATPTTLIKDWTEHPHQFIADADDNLRDSTEEKTKTKTKKKKKIRKSYYVSSGKPRGRPRLADAEKKNKGKKKSYYKAKGTPRGRPKGRLVTRSRRRVLGTGSM